MPFDIFITHATSLDQLLSAEGFAGLTEDDLDAMMRGAPASRNGQDYWVRHPNGENDPWFVASVDTGSIKLSTSYTNHRFVRNFVDMIEQGVNMAEAISANLIEETRAARITRADLDTLLSGDGDYVQFQARVWHGSIAMLGEKANAPLEFPLGPIDAVSEYFVFHITPARPLSIKRARSILEGVPNTILQGIDDKTYCLLSKESRWLTKVIERPDGKWQVWPAWGQAYFREIAPATISAAERLLEATTGSMTFYGRPYGSEIRRALHARKSGLSVECFDWAQHLPPIPAGSGGMPG